MTLQRKCSVRDDCAKEECALSMSSFLFADALTVSSAESLHLATAFPFGPMMMGGSAMGGGMYGSPMGGGMYGSPMGGPMGMMRPPGMMPGMNPGAPVFPGAAKQIQPSPEQMSASMASSPAGASTQTLLIGMGGAVALGLLTGCLLFRKSSDDDSDSDMDSDDDEKSD